MQQVWAETLWVEAIWCLGFRPAVEGWDFSWHQAVPTWQWWVTWDSQYIVPLWFLSLPRTNIRSMSVGFWKVAADCGLLHCISAVDCPDVPPQIVLGLHGQLTSLDPEETGMLNFKPGVIKIAQQFGRRGDDRSCNWQQAQPHTTWMWKNRLGFESRVVEARHAFSAAEKMATS